MCIDFKCMWLGSQETEHPLAMELRPDKCKVVFSPSTKPDIISAVTMPGSPDAWQRKKVKVIIDGMIKAGYRVVVGPPASIDKMMLDSTGMRRVKMTEPDEEGMQWSIGP